MKLARDIVERTVDGELKRDANARLIGIRGEALWEGELDVTLRDTPWRLVSCDSRLDISAHLARAEADQRLVLVAPFDDSTIGLDVLSRLARQRMLEVDRWQLVLDRFGARNVDSRVPIEPWLADLLLSPNASVPQVATGWLDEDTLWRTTFLQAMDLDSGAPDAQALLRWSVEEPRRARFYALPDDARAGLLKRLGDTLGALSQPLLALLGSGQAAALLPLGLVCEVLFPNSGKRRSDALKDAVTRLERVLDEHTLESLEGQAWRRVAMSVFDALPNAERDVQQQHASDWLERLKIGNKAGNSLVFKDGFDQRLAAFAEALKNAIHRQDSLGEVRACLDAIEAHTEAARYNDLIDRLHMVERALRWVHVHGGLPSTLGEMGRWHAQHGAYIDLARRALLGGIAHEQLASAVTALRKHLQQLRDQINHQFAKQLTHLSSALGGDSILPVEHFLDRIVCRLPKGQRALVVVMDGMDASTFAELNMSIERTGWIRHALIDGTADAGMLAALPTVTEYSRTALLSGALGQGDAQSERRNFSQHKALAARSQGAPQLFHKGDLTDDGAGDLSMKVRAAIDDARCGVVGVVINAVDDHLAKSDQLRLRWDVAAFRLLGPLLEVARAASRAIIITADHGHVLEADAQQLPGDVAERWRPAGSPVVEGEIEITGARLQQATGLDSAVLLWSEQYRYARRKMGYHGGASLQEAVVPLAIYASVEMDDEHWQESTPQLPDWWHRSFGGVAGPVIATAPAVASKASKKASRKPVNHAQIGLFEEASKADANEETSQHAAPEWIDALFVSESYAEQKASAGRVVLDDNKMRILLSTLHASAGRVPQLMLAKALSVPVLRMNGMLIAASRMLNIDGWRILTVEEAADSVRADRIVMLDMVSLRKQFELDT